MKKIFKNYAVSWLILFSLFNLTAFALPSIGGTTSTFNHTFWILYTIVTVAMTVQLVAAWFVLQNGQKDKLFLYLPIMKTCRRTSFWITVISIIAMAVPAQMYAFRYAVAFVCLLISGLSGISVVAGVSAAELVTEADDETAAKTAYIRKISAQARSLIAVAREDSHKNAVQKVYEALRYSEPAAHKDLEQIEEEIAVSFEVFADAVRRSDTTVVPLAEDLLIQIAQRNELSKSLKAIGPSSTERKTTAANIATRQKIAVILVCLITALGCVFTLWMYPRVIEPAQQYHAAQKLLKDRNYDQAAEAFAQLGSYKDADEKMKESHYLKATDLLMEGKTKAAVSIFTGLGNYSDSADMVLECEYREAFDLFQKGDYQQALAAFLEMERHEKAQQKVLECRYAIAQKFLEEGKTEEAESLLSMLGSYQDAEELVKAIRYDRAKQFLNQDLYKEAIAIFETLRGYKESEAYLDFIPENMPEEKELMEYFRKVKNNLGTVVEQVLTIEDSSIISLEEIWPDGSVFSLYSQEQGAWNEEKQALYIQDKQENILISICFRGNLALIKATDSSTANFNGYFEKES